MNQELIDITKNSAKEIDYLPKIGFLGIGWIGKNRMEGIHKSGLAKVAAIADINESLLDEAELSISGFKRFASLNDLLKCNLDGVAIATPSALHAGQAVESLNSGKAVFCQKPLGRNLEETKAAVNAAKANNLLLGVDFSYRFLRSSLKAKEIIASGDLGDIFAANLTFHNAYGPDKEWFYDVEKSGGGCLVDLGVHLIDLVLWALDFPKAEKVSGAIYSNGKRLSKNPAVVEDYASAKISFDNGADASIACSWRLNAGRDALIEISIYGTKGGLAIKNVNGSFYDFELLRYKGTSTECLDSPPDNWSAKAAVNWASRLAQGDKYDAEIEGVITVAEIIDKIYGRL